MSDTPVASHSRDRSHPDAVSHLLRSYSPQDHSADELFDSNGAVRPVWNDLLNHLAGLPDDALATRFRRGNQYLRDVGVFYRKYGDNSADERDWPLSPIPVLLTAAEWQDIATGLIQRADLLEQVAADLYGPAQLVQNGHLPASLVAQAPGWLRPMVGTTPASGRFLNFLAFEVGRGPSGQWWVLGDRTDAPSGAGFALENRVATTRVFPNFYANANVQRLAGFFQDFRSQLSDLRVNKDEPIGLLTPGQMNDGFFEHAYLARYLGLLLVEGEDLVVKNDRMHVRTVEGLRPISVLWRRLDSEFLDPLELNEDSALGTPGLLEVVRAGNLSTINAPGAGFLENRAFMAFLPQLCEVLTGQKLALPNIATWWCGQKEERAHVLSNLDQLRLVPNMGVEPAADSPPLASDLNAFLNAQGEFFVGQEAATKSTTPVWDNGGLVPRPMTLRVFLARTDQGWEVMPGGYARVGTGAKSNPLGMQEGGSVSDVWVINPERQKTASTPSLIKGEAASLAQGTALPARAADNLFWLGRYIERAEIAMRAFRAYHGLLGTGASPDDPLPDLIQKNLLFSPTSSAKAMAFAFEDPVAQAQFCAAKIRDRFSVDGMLALKELANASRVLSERPVPLEEVPSIVGILLTKVTGFAGLVHENMYRSTGWRFLSLGLSIERATQTAKLLSDTLLPSAPEGVFDLALELCDCVMSHRARYFSAPNATTVCDLVVLDARNPRSVHYHIARAREHIAALPKRNGQHQLSKCERLAMQLETQMTVDFPDQLTSQGLLALNAEICALSDYVAAEYLK
jgi:uncharacterized circularly permuted ATP-grasp superfamily protein/uncharacterized alpha-E superfamily protein